MDPLVADDSDLAGALRAVVVPLARELRLHLGGDLTPTEGSVFGCIYRAGSLTLGTIATAERLSLPTASKAVASLEGRGLVDRERDPGDGRVWWIHVTPAGHAFVDQTRSERDAWLATRLTDLGRAERDALARALPALQRLVDEDPARP